MDKIENVVSIYRKWFFPRNSSHGRKCNIFFPFWKKFNLNVEKKIFSKLFDLLKIKNIFQRF